MVDWLKGCDICNVGLLKTMDEFIKSGKSLKSTSRLLADEANREIGFELYTAKALMERYRYYKRGSKGGSGNLTPRKPKKIEKKSVDEIAKEIKNGNVSDDGLKKLSDTIADKVKDGSASPRVISKASNTFEKKFRSGRRKEKFLKKKSDCEIITNTFFNAINWLDHLVGKGPDQLSENDRNILTSEFRMQIPRLIKILLNMGVDVLAITNEIIKRRIERGSLEKSIKSNAESAV